MKKLTLILACLWLIALTPSCTEVPVNSGSSAAGTVGQDLNNAAAKATQVYMDVKAGNFNYAYAVQLGLDAYSMYIHTKDDVVRVVKMMGGSQSYAEKLAALFRTTPPTPAKVQAVAAGVGTAALDHGKP